MKKAFIYAALLLTLSSCSLHQYAIGTSEKDFTSSQKYNLELVESTTNHSVYRRIAQVNDKGTPLTYMYYYFRDSTLVRSELVDVPQPRVVVVKERNRG